MKSLLNLSFVAILITIALDSSGQTFCIKGGLNLSDTHFIIDDGFDEPKMNPGFHLGPVMELDLNNDFSIETGFLITTKGFKINSSLPDETGVEETYKVNTNLYYIDVPFNIKAKLRLNGFEIYGSAGPYMGIGIKGKGKLELGDEKETSTIKFGPDENVKRLEFGLNFGGGLEFSHFLFGLNYGLGLTNTSQQEGVKAKNRVLSISVGYKFGKHKKEKG